MARLSSAAARRPLPVRSSKSSLRSAGIDLLVAPDADMVVLEVNGIPGWQALQSVSERNLTQLVVTAWEALASRV